MGYGLAFFAGVLFGLFWRAPRRRRVYEIPGRALPAALRHDRGYTAGLERTSPNGERTVVSGRR